jgi:hypothetical protein
MDHMITDLNALVWTSGKSEQVCEILTFLETRPNMTILQEFSSCASSSSAFSAGLEDKVRNIPEKRHEGTHGGKALITYRCPLGRYRWEAPASWRQQNIYICWSTCCSRGQTIGTRNYAAEKPLMEQIEKTAQSLMAEKLKLDKADKKKIEDLTKKLAALEAEQDKYVLPNEYSQIYAKNGGLSLNAFTSRDTTAYMVNLPSNKLELWAPWNRTNGNAVLRQFYGRNVVWKKEAQL